MECDERLYFKYSNIFGKSNFFFSCFVNKNPTYDESNLKWFMPHFKFLRSTTEYNLDPVLNSTATVSYHQIIGDYYLYLQLDMFVFMYIPKVQIEILAWKYPVCESSS